MPPRALVLTFLSLLVASAPGCSKSGAPVQGLTVLTVQGTEMQFSPAGASVAAGHVRFHFVNAGHVEHELAIMNGSETLSSRTLSAGQSADLDVVKLAAGTEYTMICREPGHAQAGMRGTITVR